MFTGVLWKTELYDKTTDEFKTHAFKYIRTIYLQNGPYYFALFSVKNIMDLLVRSYIDFNSNLRRWINMMNHLKRRL